MLLGVAHGVAVRSMPGSHASPQTPPPNSIYSARVHTCMEVGAYIYIHGASVSEASSHCALCVCIGVHTELIYARGGKEERARGMCEKGMNKEGGRMKRAKARKRTCVYIYIDGYFQLNGLFLGALSSARGVFSACLFRESVRQVN